MKDDVFKQAIFNKEKFKSQLEYWERQISGPLKPVDLAVDFNRKNRGERVVDTLKILIPEELSRELINFRKKSDLTLYVVMLAAFKAFLFRFTRNKETIIVSPLLNLDKSDGSVEHYKYNKKVILKDDVDTGLTFKELLKVTKDRTLEAYKNQNYPLDMVFLKRGLNMDHFFSLDRIIFSLKNLHKEKDIMDLEFELLFSFSWAGDHLCGEIVYHRSLFKQKSIERFSRRYIRILDFCLRNLDARVRDIPILSEEELKQLLVDFNNTGYPCQGDITIHQLVEEQVEKTPDKIAVVSLGSLPYCAVSKNTGKKERLFHLSFRELNLQANRLASLLKKRGVGADSIVALMMKPSLEMIIGILGILKAGGAYLPIDPAYPENRINSLLNESQPALLLTEEELLRDFSFISLKNLQGRSVKTVITPNRPLVDDLDSLQKIDRSYIDYKKYSPFIGQSMIKNSITFQFSRGCMYKCVYCFKIWPNDRYVHRSAENMFDELLFYYKMGVRKFSFVDDLPNFNIKESAKFYQMIIKNRLKVQMFYPNGLRGDILTRDYIDLMVEAGTVSLDVALETTSRRLQKLIGKNLNLARLHENIIYMIEKHPQLILETQLLHGIPTETEEEAQNSLDYLKSLKWIHMPYLHVLKIYPNTDMARLAMDHGVPGEAIEGSDDLGYNELPDTLPFNRNFTRRYQAEFASEYFMSRERLLAVLPYQMNALTEDELVQKYNSFLPVNITSFQDLIDYVEISREELEGDFLANDYGVVPDINEKIREQSPRKVPGPGALKVLLIDVSAYFSHQRHHVIYDVVEPSLGLMYLQTHLDRTFADKVHGKIVSSRIDFDNFDELKTSIDDFKPDVIGIRTLNFYKDFFHRIVSLIRQWGIDVPIIAGGPYASSSYPNMLRDTNIDVAVLKEGEITFTELIREIMENNASLPDDDRLKEIEGIAFVEKKEKMIQRNHTREILLMDKWYHTMLNEYSNNPEPASAPGNLSYIIYTSGTTGLPKGVMIEHNNLVNQVNGLVKRFDLGDAYNYLLLTAFTFDVSVMHIFLPLITGAKLFVISEEEKRDPLRLWEFIRDNDINILNIVPAFMKALLENMKNKRIRFEYLLLGGDVFDKELYNALETTFDVKKIFNIYGPTETTINATLYECDKGTMGEKIPIGTPLLNYRAYIMDKHLDILPPGMPGELYISGNGVARGYLNHPELTAEKFVEDIHHKGESMYRTGDLARWLEDGNIDFLGRIDQQLKIRGFRIEPREIEQHLLRYKGVKEAVVSVHEEMRDEKYICAYFVSDREYEISELGGFLSGELPNYMIPAYFVRLEKIPLASNGKVDRKALPGPERTIGESYIAPRDEVETKLAEIWSEVLEIEKDKIGIETNFFELGGHSLKATILVSKIHKEFEVKVPVAELFKAPRIEALSGYIKRRSKDTYMSIKSGEKKEYYPLSSAQKRLYILQQMRLDSTAYNMPEFIPLDMDFDVTKIEDAFKKLIARHENFHTSFYMVNDEPVQRVHDEAGFELEYTGLEPGPGGMGKNFVRAFDLTRAPLLRVVLVEPAAGGTGTENRHKHAFLMVDMHHIISDGVSHDILFKDFMAIYDGQVLPPLRLQYKDFSQWQDSEKIKAAIKQQEIYWLGIFKDRVPDLDLPTDFPRDTVQSDEGSILFFEISREQVNALNIIASEEGATLFMILVAIYYILLFKITGQESIIVGIPVEGRKHPDLQNIIGMFVNMLALRNHPRGEKTCSDFFKEVKNTVLKALENQDYQFEDLVDKLAVKRTPGRNPLFDTVLRFDKTGESQDETSTKKENEEKEIQFSPENRPAKFDLILNIVDSGNRLVTYFNFKKQLFKPETIERIANYFKTLISEVIKNPLKKISEIEILSEDERRRLIQKEKSKYVNKDRNISPGITTEKIKVEFNF